MFYSAVSQVLKIEGKRLFLLPDMVDLDIGSLSSFISRTPTDFKRRSVHVGREEHRSQDSTHADLKIIFISYKVKHRGTKSFDAESS